MTDLLNEGEHREVGPVVGCLLLVRLTDVVGRGLRDRRPPPTHTSKEPPRGINPATGRHSPSRSTNPSIKEERMRMSVVKTVFVVNTCGADINVAIANGSFPVSFFLAIQHAASRPIGVSVTPL